MAFDAVRQIHWRDLKEGVTYEIKNYVAFDDRLRLLLAHEGVTYSLWAPDRVRYVIEGQEFTHLRSYGKKDGRWAFDVAKCILPSILCG